MPPVRTLIVDDSASMRATLNRMLSADPDIEVVGMAPETSIARAMIKVLNPDVITLDVEMPGMDGITFLDKIMRLRPMPVVMCSALTTRGAELCIEALRLGAVDCIGKPAGTPHAIARDADLLCETVKLAARSTVRGDARPIRADVASRPTAPFRDMVVAMGSSTGGVEALFAILSALPIDCPPVLVVQHMPAAFTASFAARLDRDCAVHVVEARDGMPIEPGTVYIAPGGAYHMQFAGGARRTIRLREGDLVNGHRPSVDVLFNSLQLLGSAALGVILTGMGADGAAGLLAMRRAGARTLGQSRETCVIYGMPRAALAAGAVEREVGLSGMVEAIQAACRKMA